ncbi:hypothetical protein [Pseudothauera rhizosphaerae]|uniref:hypothetical protein n=1 Tax=Pseudothauera rhizosphaerae TaxID=2565932 RepID=UPI001454D99A|nr:hypothetical protein [Pseudothauera rhizosphaerae]
MTMLLGGGSLFLKLGMLAPKHDFLSWINRHKWRLLSRLREYIVDKKPSNNFY